MHNARGRFRAPPGVWLEVLLFRPVFVLLYRLGMFGRAPLWLNLGLLVGLLGFVVANQYFGRNTRQRERAEAAVRASEERSGRWSLIRAM
ncbi:MAG TPA: hypothetical protein VK891_10965 [Euzebyales bacterium]|nr:hypothetical protein [Euzebyales bacterium]